MADSIPRGSGLIEWVISFPTFLTLALGVIQILVIAFHGLMLTYSAQELARLISLQGVEAIDQERAASQAMSWVWAGNSASGQSVQGLVTGLVHPSVEYMRARGLRTLQINRISPSREELANWASPHDHRFLPLSPGEHMADNVPEGQRSMKAVSTIDVEVVSVMHLSVPFIGQIMGEVIAASQGCQGPLAMSEDCLFLKGSHPLHPGEPMLPMKRRGRSLLQPAIDMASHS
ncbi:MAG: hypothetical protein RL133_1325 [Pseudomonadota bacterium]